MAAPAPSPLAVVVLLQIEKDLSGTTPKARGLHRFVVAFVSMLSIDEGWPYLSCGAAAVLAVAARAETTRRRNCMML